MPKAGEILSTREDNPGPHFLREILTALAARGMVVDVDAIDLSNPVGAEFDYLDGRFKVRLEADERNGITKLHCWLRSSQLTQRAGFRRH